MIGTYAAVLAVCGASLAIGQAALALCGARRWSWLSPAVGLALLCAVCWGTVRLPGHGAVSALAVLVLALAAVLFLRGRVDGTGKALRMGLPVGLLALGAASLPFLVEGHFGILGTSFNPDMSQHLLAAERLAHGEGSQLLHQGYPLGPHAVAVALDKGLGIGLVQGFDGLTVAVAVLASLTALAAFADLPPLRRTAGALLVGIPYLVASYYAQGAFKETMQTLFVLAFILSLREATRAWRDLPLRFVPAAIIAAGSVYTYSFPGLIWLIGTAAIWAIAEYAVSHLRSSAGGVAVGGTAATGPAADHLGTSPKYAGLLALLAFAVLIAPELGRMIDFGSFETFDPNGPGLGNLFGQISPLEALGIWPSGDFRLAPGDGAAPAAAYYLGAAFALALLPYGLAQCWRRRETAILAGLLAAAGVYAAARAGGTPYTAAKAIEVAAPLAALTILLSLLGRGSAGDPRRFRGTGVAADPSPRRFRRTGTAADPHPRRFRGTALGGSQATVSCALAAAYVLAAGGCSLLALANAPVGPISYTPALAELRPTVNSAPTVVLASRELLADQHGTPYLAWELRGGRVCIEADSEAGGSPPPGVRFVISQDPATRPPFRDLRLRRLAPPYVLWERTGTVRGRSPCPLIAVRQARQGPG